MVRGWRQEASQRPINWKYTGIKVYNSLWGGTSWDLKVEITPSHHEQHKINSWTLVYAYRTKQTNKNPAGFYSDGTRDLVSSGRKRVSSEDTTAILLQGFMAGYLPASSISGHCSLTNMGHSFISVQLAWGRTVNMCVLCVVHATASFIFLIPSKTQKFGKTRSDPNEALKGVRML